MKLSWLGKLQSQVCPSSHMWLHRSLDHDRRTMLLQLRCRHRLLLQVLAQKFPGTGRASLWDQLEDPNVLQRSLCRNWQTFVTYVLW